MEQTVATSSGRVRLNNGKVMPSLGLGTAKVEGDMVRAAVDNALDVCYRHIDTAHTYDNEGDIGKTLQNQIRSGKVKRNDLFVTTKVPIDHMEEKDVKEVIKMSLCLLQLDYIDLVVIHAPWSVKQTNKPQGQHPTEEDFVHHDIVATWHALEGLVHDGLVRSIGLSNFTVQQIERIWQNAEIKPANLQLECHVYLQQLTLRSYCEQRDIVVTGYCPLGTPGRSDHNRRDDDPEVLRDPVVVDIAKRLGHTPAQVALRFLIQLNATAQKRATRTNC